MTSPDPTPDLDHGYLQFGTAPGPFLTVRVPVKHEHADRYLARYEGRWRRIHIQVRRLYIVYRGEIITIQVKGL